MAAITEGRLSLTVLPPIGRTCLPLTSPSKPSFSANLADAALKERFEAVD
jgi:hypothetical protein